MDNYTIEQLKHLANVESEKIDNITDEMIDILQNQSINQYNTDRLIELAEKRQEHTDTKIEYHQEITEMKAGE